MKKVLLAAAILCAAITVNAQLGVGINEPTPGSKLSVNGNLAIGNGYSPSAAPTDGAIIKGNVGIGTLNPAAKLDVNGNTYLRSVSQGTSTTERYYPNVVSSSLDNYVTGAWIIHTPISRTSNAMFTIHVHGYGYLNADVIDFTISGYAYDTYLGSIDGAAGAITNTKLRDVGTDGYSKYIGIDANGKVAVAFGDIANVSYFYRISVDAWITRFTTDYSTGWSIDQNTNANFNWKDKQGPMTSSIKGAISITGTGQVAVTGLANSSTVYTDATGKLTTAIPTAGAQGFWNRTGTTLSTGNAGDNVVIGGTTANAKFEVDNAVLHTYPNPGLTQGTVHIAPGAAANGHSSSITFGATNGGPEAQAGIYVQSSGTYGTKMYFGTTTSYAAGVQGRMMIDADGKIGIGNIAPTVKLKVTGDIETGGMVRATNWLGDLAGGVGTGPGAEIGYTGSSAYFHAYNRTSGTYIPARVVGSTISIAHSDAVTPDVFVSTTGKVGIGTNNPTEALSVNGGISTANGWVKRDFATFNTVSATPAVIHIKTNIPVNNSTNMMYRIVVEGYNYHGAAGIYSEASGYSSNSQGGIIGQSNINHSPGAAISQYITSDGFVAIKLTHGSTFYYAGFSVSAWLTNPNGQQFDIKATTIVQQVANL